MLSFDTSREARRIQIALLRRLGGARRIARAFEMSHQARELSQAGIRRREPGCSAAEARSQLLRRLWGDALYHAAYQRERP